MRSRVAGTLSAVAVLLAASVALAATTAGFYTVGTMTVEDGAFVFHEVVKGSAGGVTEVKATSRLLPDGRLLVRSQHLKSGKWEDGRETYYVEDPQAVVRFKE